MRARWVLLIALTSLTVAPGGAAAAAATAPPAPVLGPADGVQAARTGAKSVELRFTGASAAALAGKEISVACGAHPLPGGLLLVDRGDDGPSVTGSGTVGADGVAAVALTGSSGRLDACDVTRFVEPRTLRLVARAALDESGAIWVDEVARAHALRDLLTRARSAAAYAPAATVARGAVVALDGPAAAAPAGQLGYWTDGAAHAVATTTSLGGRRLLIEDLGDGALRTNVLDQGEVLGPVFEAALGGETTTGGGLSLDEEVEPDADAHGRPYRGRAVTSGDGVRARFVGRRLIVQFTGRSAVAARKLAGRRVLVTCVVRPARGLFGGAVHEPVAHAAVARMPTRGRTLRLLLLDPEEGIG